METGAELILFPAPEVGHLLAEVELGRRLVALNPQLSISILLPKLPVPSAKTEEYIRSLDTEFQRNPHQRISLVELPTLEDPQPNPSGPSFYVLLIHRLATLSKPTVKRFVEERRRTRRIAGIVFDMFCTPMVDVAEELGVPSYLFYSSGANFLSLTFKLESLKADDLPALFEGMQPDSTPVDFPGFKTPVPLKAWPAVFLNRELEMAGPICDFASVYRKTRGILVNTFSELDSDILKSLYEDERIPPVYPVGPILYLNRDRNGNGSTKSSPRDPIMSWLDEQPAKSVLFFCFGSKVPSFERVQMEQLAAGIERSGHRFLWSVRAPLDEVLPEGFLDRTAGVGKVIGWAPQTEVLGHVAVGAFVSHCGWNSILESIWFRVPMVTWPMYSEQQLNAFLLVKVLGLAVGLTIEYTYDFGKKKANVVVDAAEVESAIRRMMEGEEGMAVRSKCEEMSEIASKAMEVGGSSYLSFSKFFQDLAVPAGCMLTGDL